MLPVPLILPEAGVCDEMVCSHIALVSPCRSPESLDSQRINRRFALRITNREFEDRHE